MVQKLNCYKACGIHEDQGSNPCPLHWQVGCHPLYHQGSLTCPFLFAFLPPLRWADSSDSLLNPCPETLMSGIMRRQDSGQSPHTGPHVLAQGLISPVSPTARFITEGSEAECVQGRGWSFLWLDPRLVPLPGRAEGLGKGRGVCIGDRALESLSSHLRKVCLWASHRSLWALFL